MHLLVRIDCIKYFVSLFRRLLNLNIHCYGLAWHGEIDQQLDEELRTCTLEVSGSKEVEPTFLELIYSMWIYIFGQISQAIEYRSRLAMPNLSINIFIKVSGWIQISRKGVQTWTSAWRLLVTSMCDAH